MTHLKAHKTLSDNYLHSTCVVRADSDRSAPFADNQKKVSKKFAGLEKMPTFAIPFGKYAEIAQLVEHNLAKVGVASSSLVFRSKRSLREI